jgi:UDP-N-acetylglucosamine--N-acetylmuramyl-(pentapeptide) pyrophosphoryl-undecaprenol N-acetylglucosamine transferase
MFFAWLKCCFYIIKYKPDVIFGTGGYVSAPVLIAGIAMKIPFVMHDCDANPGLVTRKLSPYAKSISIAFDAAREKLNNKNIYLNGNPIRTEFANLTKEQAKNDLKLQLDKLTICIMGGSQGAKTINEATVNILEKLSKELNLQVIFQTGKKNYDDVIKNLKEIYTDFENDNNIIVRPYFDNMVTVLKASDIAVSRAGSLSISELCASGVATIYIPYPYAAADHQRKNAKSMVEQGAGIYLEDAQTTPETLLNLIRDLSVDKSKLKQIQKASLSLAKYDGVQKIVEQIIKE